MTTNNDYKYSNTLQATGSQAAVSMLQLVCRTLVKSGCKLTSYSIEGAVNDATLTFTMTGTETECKIAEAIVDEAVD